MQGRALPTVRLADMPRAFQEKRPELAGREAEFKGFAGEIKADAAGRTVELYIAQYGTVDTGGDLILPGAAAQSIRDDFPRGLVKLFWNHEMAIGPATVLEEKDGGLFMAGRVTDHPTFDPCLAQVVDGTAAHGSLGWTPVEWEILSASEVRKRYGADPLDFKAIRVIKRMRVWEGSPVIWPMHEGVHVVGVKSWSLGTDGKGGLTPMETKDLWDLSDALAALARLRNLATAEWAQLTDAEAEVAREVIEAMTQSQKAISNGLAARETKKRTVEIDFDTEKLVEMARNWASTEKQGGGPWAT